jgi:hypothetical protein
VVAVIWPCGRTRLRNAVLVWSFAIARWRIAWSGASLNHSMRGDCDQRIVGLGVPELQRVSAAWFPADYCCGPRWCCSSDFHAGSPATDLFDLKGIVQCQSGK